MIKILYIDDIQADFNLFEVLVSRKLKCEVSYAETQKDAEMLLSNNYYDIIVIDINLGGENGYEVYSNIKSNSNYFIITSGLISHNTSVSIDEGVSVVNKDKLVNEALRIVKTKGFISELEDRLSKS